MMIKIKSLTSNLLLHSKWPIKLFMGLLTSLVLLAGGYFFVIRNQLLSLLTAERQQQQLQAQLLDQASLLTKLRENKSRQQPKQSIQTPMHLAVAKLLQIIVAAGEQDGLQFKLIRPDVETIKDGYVDFVIVGNYQQISNFIRRTTAWSGIITWHDFTLDPIKGNGQNTKNKGSTLLSLTIRGVFMDENNNVNIFSRHNDSI